MAILEPGRQRRRQRPTAAFWLWLMAAGTVLSVIIGLVVR
jgi:hypothetical protein